MVVNSRKRDKVHDYFFNFLDPGISLVHMIDSSCYLSSVDLSL